MIRLSNILHYNRPSTTSCCATMPKPENNTEHDNEHDDTGNGRPNYDANIWSLVTKRNNVKLRARPGFGKTVAFFGIVYRDKNLTWVNSMRQPLQNQGLFWKYRGAHLRQHSFS